jgi:hypothetical protein
VQLLVLTRYSTQQHLLVVEKLVTTLAILLVMVALAAAAVGICLEDRAVMEIPQRPHQVKETMAVLVIVLVVLVVVTELPVEVEEQDLLVNRQAHQTPMQVTEEMVLQAQ